ncbi:MAG: tryptophan halogenase [Alteromonadaceae bacterium]|nr:tryptophan halogenase [Alteromonadaceae bacterium]
MENKVKRIVIAGGGTAGWMAAAAFTRLLGKTVDVSLVESDLIPTVGVGEATIPTLHLLHRLLKIDERQLMAATNATFKLGISFENWKNVGENYIHSFGYLRPDCWACGFHHFWLKGKEKGMVTEIGDYVPEYVGAKANKFAVLPNQDLNHAYHLDAGLYAKYLRKLTESCGGKRIEGSIEEVLLNQENGHISGLKLASGQIVEGDLFIDCTGFRGLLIEQTLHAGYDDWSHYLPCDSAIAVQTESVQAPIPYTRSIAREAGWQWRIPLQNRTGNGHVFCSKYISDDQAIDTLLNNIEGKRLNDPRVIKYKTGSRRKHWVKNCVAVGLSSGFIEPLESTGIHLFQKAIVRLLTLFPQQDINQADIDEYNQQTRDEALGIRDFIIMHYHVTQRTDTAFWRHCQNMPIPDSLKHRLNLFSETGKVFKKDSELFGETSWVQCLIGQGMHPKAYHPIVDMMTDDELQKFLDNAKNNANKKAATWPNHWDFIQHYCRANAM